MWAFVVEKMTVSGILVSLLITPHQSRKWGISLEGLAQLTSVIYV